MSLWWLFIFPIISKWAKGWEGIQGALPSQLNAVQAYDNSNKGNGWHAPYQTFKIFATHTRLNIAARSPNFFEDTTYNPSGYTRVRLHSVQTPKFDLSSRFIISQILNSQPNYKIWLLEAEYRNSIRFGCLRNMHSLSFSFNNYFVDNFIPSNIK